jgi:hypothetical protein
VRPEASGAAAMLRGTVGGRILFRDRGTAHSRRSPRTQFNQEFTEGDKRED